MNNPQIIFDPAYYIIFVHGCVEPELFGPYPSSEFLSKARKLVAEFGTDENCFFKLIMDEHGLPNVSSFLGSDFEEGEWEPVIDDAIENDGFCNRCMTEHLDGKCPNKSQD